MEELQLKLHCLCSGTRVGKGELWVARQTDQVEGLYRNFRV